ncbi:MAG: MBL fold metallo-hydrolase [Gammaproteobacteria bacterium]
MNKPTVTGFFDEATNTISYVVVDDESRQCAIIDSLLDYDPAAGRTATDSADRLIDFVRKNDLTCEWIIDTHVHADHLTAAPYIRDKLGGKTAIGDQISVVQKVFGDVFNAGQSFHTDGRQFDHLFTAGESYQIGNIQAKAIATPGHTPVCTSHLIGDALFVGDTIFMPDFGTARCDFPGGDAGVLFDSIQALFELPDDTRMFLCHDYKAPGRDEYAWETTVGEQKRSNVHVKTGTTKEAFIAQRTARDAQLGMPKLILPSVQINMRAGNLPPVEDNGKHYMKIPINAL